MVSALLGEPSVALVGVFYAPLPRPTSRLRRMRKVLRHHGVSGLLGSLARRLRRLAIAPWQPLRTSPLESMRIPFRGLKSFHDDEGLAAISAASPDFIVVDGTYILPSTTFSLAGSAALNLHCGKLPDYRGAPPVFWELYYGEREVGVTIHGVTSNLDGGPIYNQQLFQLPRAVDGDPVAFTRNFWLKVLRPAGIALMMKTIKQINDCTATPVEQPRPSRPAFKSPDLKKKRELRKIMLRRQRGG